MARPEDAASAEANALHDDLRLALRALDTEVGRLVGVLDRFETLWRQGPPRPPQQVATPAERPKNLADLRE